jgi:nucleotide-binding universal stress UspA family protein
MSLRSSLRLTRLRAAQRRPGPPSRRLSGSARRSSSSTFGAAHQRRLDAEIFAAKRALRAALAAAERAGVAASGEELAGSPARQLVEFARLRGARLVVLGSRRRRFGRSVSRSVIRAADRPVLVAGASATAIA